ncbi:MAG TPA: DUF2254 domain-containing protein [Gemmatimonadales bacterium]|nr:DUF2254 domain-containing protein [Gemmatimonadales bacterium]
MRGRIFAVRQYLGQSLWFIPALAIVGAVVLSEIAVAIDRRLDTSGDHWYVFSGGPDTARTVVSTIAASMITFTALVFSITMLVLQLSSSQLSPRIMRTFLRDRVSQGTLAVFIATFTYSLLALRHLGELTTSGDLASIAVWLSVLLVVLSVLLFVYYIHHIAQAIRPVMIIGSIKAETRRALEQTYPADDPDLSPALPQREPGAVINLEGRSGILVDLSLAQLQSVAHELSLQIELLPPVGEFVLEGSPLFRVWGNPPDSARARLGRAVTVGRERTMEHDPRFGLRQLVDIGVRALSPGINDPTTAVQVLDALLELLAFARQRPTTEVTVAGDEERIFLHRPSWDELVKLSVEEIRQYGSSSSQVLHGLERLLTELLARAREDQKPVLRRELILVQQALRGQFGQEGTALVSQA